VPPPEAAKPAAPAAAHGLLGIDQELGGSIYPDAISPAFHDQDRAVATTVCIRSIDGGLTGAPAFYFPQQNAISAEDMPVAGGDVDPATLFARIGQMRPDLAILESAASRPGQGVASVFRYGAGFGAVKGVIAASGIPLHLVSPSRWKKHFLLDSDKEKSRASALRLWPTRSHLFGRKRDHGRAEAALLARYAAERIVSLNPSTKFAGPIPHLAGDDPARGGFTRELSTVKKGL
jgi:hypothetical protein